MPSYEYACTDCGAFEAIRPIADRDRAADCPGCGRGAPRVFAVGAHVTTRMDPSARRIIASQERAAADGAYRRMRHPAACGCCRG